MNFMNACITPQMIVDNWQTTLPVTLLSIEYIMGLIPGSKAKGLSHLALIAYQNYKARKPSGSGPQAPQAPPLTQPPAGPTP